MKGSLVAALQFTQSSELRDKAQSEYMDAVYAQQTVNSKTALRQTWTKLCQSLGYEPVPLTAIRCMCVGCAVRGTARRRRAPEVPWRWLAFLCEKGPRDAGSPSWPSDRYEVWCSRPAYSS